MQFVGFPGFFSLCIAAPRTMSLLMGLTSRTRATFLHIVWPCLLIIDVVCFISGSVEEMLAVHLWGERLEISEG